MTNLNQLDQYLQTANRQRNEGRMDIAITTLDELNAQLRADTAAAVHETVDKERMRIGVRTHMLYALILSDQSRLTEARDHLATARRFTAVAGDKDDGRLTYALADIDRKQGKFDKALEGFEAAIDLFEKSGQQKPAAETRGSVAHLLSAQGLLTDAVRYRRAAVEIASRLSDPLATAILRGDLGKDLYRLDRLVDAREQIDLALPILADSKDGNATCLSYANSTLGDILIAQGHIPAARDAYLRAAQTTISPCKALALTKLGWWELRHRDTPSASAYFKAARDIDPAHDDEKLRLEATAGLAIAYCRMNEHAEALSNLDDALTQKTQNTTPYAEGFVYAAQAVLFQEAGRDADAAERAVLSDQAFGKSARPLVGLARRLSLCKPL